MARINRLRELRKAKKLTLQKVATRAGTSPTQILRLERDERRLTWDWAQRLATAMDADPTEIMFGGKAPSVPVVGRVGAGARVFPVDDHAQGDGLYEVACPRGLDPATTVAVEVDGDSMPPLESGWILFYSRAHEQPGSALLGRLCVVKIANDGPTLVKQVRRGYTAGRFNLISTNGPPIEDVDLEWAAQVKAMLSPEEARGS